MKRLLRILLLAAALAAVLCIGAAAADVSTVDGVYDVQTTAAALKFYTAAGTTELQPETAYITETEAVDMYQQAVRFDVTATGGTASSQYLLLVCKGTSAPSEDNIVYINQTAADAEGTISFSGENGKAYPSTMAQDDYFVYIIGAGKTYDSSKTAAQNAAASFKTYSAYTLGDADGDNYVTSADASKVLRHVAQLETLSGTRALAANVDGDEGITSADAAKILRYVAQLITNF